MKSYLKNGAELVIKYLPSYRLDHVLKTQDAELEVAQSIMFKLLLDMIE